jgi:large subunit ribosomal protein L19e
MQFGAQKRLSAQILKCGVNKVWFDSTRLEDIKEAITKADIRSLIHDGAIAEKHGDYLSRGRARAKHLQKRKGQQRGWGSRKGKKTARSPKKLRWSNAIRVQRRFLKELRSKQIVTKTDYQILYLKAKGGFFRSKRHIKLYLEEHNLAQKRQAT